MEEQIKQQQHTKPANAMDKKSSFSYIVDETLDECRFGFTREKKKGRTESQNVRGKKKGKKKTTCLMTQSALKLTLTASLLLRRVRLRRSVYFHYKHRQG